jgi:hypothetical protein
MPTVDSRLVLVGGFGGLLILMAFAGADGIQALQQIQSRNDLIRDDFMLRTQVLERIRGDLYLSGTDVRDYLLEPQAGRAEGHRYTLLETRKDMDAALQQYSQLLSSGEAEPFRVLTRELDAYWRVLEPTFVWTAEQRQKAVFAFNSDERLHWNFIPVEAFPRNGLLAKDPSLLGPAAAPYAHLPGGHQEAWADAFRNVLRDIYQFIAAGKSPADAKPPAFATFEDGYHAACVVDAILDSHRRGGVWTGVRESVGV